MLIHGARIIQSQEDPKIGNMIRRFSQPQFIETFSIDVYSALKSRVLDELFKSEKYNSRVPFIVQLLVFSIVFEDKNQYLIVESFAEIDKDGCGDFGFAKIELTDEAPTDMFLDRINEIKSI